MYGNDEFVSLVNSNSDNSEFVKIEKYSQQGENLNWKKEKTDIDNKIIKQISKSSENDFVAICEKNGNSTLAKFNVEDGSVVEEYDLPTYENIYAIENEDEFILLGSPMNEEGITITGEKGAVIAKYAIE